MQPGRVDIITMGCSKNLVDSEQLMRLLECKGYDMHHDSHDVCGEIVVINTCGFIGDAKQESIDMILRMCEAKANGVIDKLYVMGCLSQRYLNDLKAEIPDVDKWFGKFDWRGIANILPDRVRPTAAVAPWERKLATSAWSAYIKISEGCDRMCSYCAIPLITGRHKSRKPEDILDEVRTLAGRGVKEFNIIAQDLSAYGTDMPGNKSQLAELINSIADIPGVKWIRLHYAYPVDFPYDLLPVMRHRKNVCKYLDIALQHISSPILSAMRRHVNKEQTVSLISRIRAEVPGIRLRTTLMTGFPGEGDKEFDELVQFVKDTRFDRLGVFAYSEEEGTWASRHLKDVIPIEVKEDRKDKLLDLHEDIALSLNEELIGQTLEVLIDGTDEDGGLIARTEWDSPEVDHIVHVNVPGNKEKPVAGSFVKVHITDCLPYDLYGELV